jgi:hypothetical protein
MLHTTLNQRTITLLYLLFAFSTFDFALTCYAINCGIAHEVNPLLSWTTLEGIGIAKTAGLMILIYRNHNRARVLQIVAAILSLVCVWNILAIAGVL